MDLIVQLFISPLAILGLGSTHHTFQVIPFLFKQSIDKIELT